MRRLRISFALAAVMALTLALPVSAGIRETAPVLKYGTTMETEGSASMVRTPAGVAVNVHLKELTPGNAITVWFVHFNECVDADACNPSDLGIPDSGNGAIWSQIGGVVGRNGQFNQGTFIAVGENTGGPAPVALSNPLGAEIHLVVQDHGPALTGADLVEQTTTFEGGCGNGMPPTSEADGDTCVDVQVVGFLFPNG